LTNEKTRLPRGTHVVADAFLAAVDLIPSERRQEVAKAALGIVKAGLADRKAKAGVNAKAPRKSSAAKRIGVTPVANSVKKISSRATAKQKPVARKARATKPKLALVPTRSPVAAAA